MDIYRNTQGELNCQVRIGYQGPVSLLGRSLPRIKLDLTAGEQVILNSVQSPVFHLYEAIAEQEIAIQTNAYEEIFGSVMRALAKRTRPCDLYDVMKLFRNTGLLPPATSLQTILSRKCAFKRIEAPDLASLESRCKALENSW